MQKTTTMKIEYGPDESGAVWCIYVNGAPKGMSFANRVHAKKACEYLLSVPVMDLLEMARVRLYNVQSTF